MACTDSALIGFSPIVRVIRVGQLCKPALDQGLLNEAVSFFNAANRCQAEVKLSPWAGVSLMRPAVVCYAFSLELYLKLLHVSASGKSTWGHELNTLYNGLPPTTKSDLLAECYGIDLVGELTSAANAFKQWRYSHEHETLAVDPSKLADIIGGCHRLVRRLNPKLEVFGENTTVQQFT
jgi:hypothetical protein